MFRIFEQNSYVTRVKSRIARNDIEEIWLTGERLDHQEAKKICRLLRKANLNPVSDYVTSLTLTTCVMLDQALTEFIKHLGDNDKLTTFQLKITPITTKQMEVLADVLKNNSTLTTLWLQECSIDYPGVAHLADALIQNTTLKTLGLEDIDCDNEGLKILSKTLAINNTLEELDVYGNHTITNLMPLFQALRVNTSIKSLNLSYIKINDAMAKSLADVVHLDRLTNLSLQGCDISIKGAHDLAKALKTNSELKKLDIQFNEFNDQISTVSLFKPATNPNLEIADENIVQHRQRNSW